MIHWQRDRQRTEEAGVQGVWKMAVGSAVGWKMECVLLASERKVTGDGQRALQRGAGRRGDDDAVLEDRGGLRDGRVAGAGDGDGGGGSRAACFRTCLIIAANNAVWYHWRGGR